MRTVIERNNADKKMIVKVRSKDGTARYMVEQWGVLPPELGDFGTLHEARACAGIVVVHKPVDPATLTKPKSAYKGPSKGNSPQQSKGKR